MKTRKTSIPALLIAVTVLVSCNKSKDTKDVTLEAPRDTVVQNTTPPAPDNVLSDTVGLYKITNAEAKAYIVDMYSVLTGIEKAVDSKDIGRMPSLMSKQQDLQRKQGAIQSALSEADRKLFNVYINKVADKLDAVAKKVESI